MLPAPMPIALILLAALAALIYWQSTGQALLQGLPGWLFPALAGLLVLFVVYRLARWLYVSITDLSD
ncbi:hypothetical protein E0493_00485 [Roseomonas sp. M0104]|uniref:DUF4175 domain-containing protein n=1 Tax=Teichococcus coralli TaxID=2545983 RepID=A0A845B5B1_9PROT|nr:hypothetical protein [Pseudoroseomonas coralli]MXP61825.1 hypothetical protein [Pseudoroseomonas coralli]